MAEKTKMTKDVVPEGFNIPMVLVDAIPVLFFGLSVFLLGAWASSLTLIIGGLVCTISGFIKVMWKLVVVISKRNAWPLFVQMRIFMPIGFLIMIIALFRCGLGIFSEFFTLAIIMPQLIFFAIWLLSFILMTVFAIVLDASDPKSNWIEQITNSIGQIAFFIGMLLAYF